MSYKYDPSMVADSRVRMSKFVLSLSEMVLKKCRTSILINDIDIYNFMVHEQQIEEERLKAKSREVKSANMGDGNFSYAMSDEIVVLDSTKFFRSKYFQSSS